MNDLLEKAQTQPESIRATETANIQNFDVPKQSFTDKVKSANTEVTLIQISNDDDFEDAPNPAVYRNQRGGFIDAMNDSARVHSCN